jgi:hypothetical protein
MKSLNRYACAISPTSFNERFELCSGGSAVDDRELHFQRSPRAAALRREIRVPRSVTLVQYSV